MFELEKYILPKFEKIHWSFKNERFLKLFNCHTGYLSYRKFFIKAHYIEPKFLKCIM